MSVVAGRRIVISLIPNPIWPNTSSGVGLNIFRRGYVQNNQTTHALFVLSKRTGNRQFAFVGQAPIFFM